ncbi:hypothetical protein [Dysgonomonas sp. 520]|uniref:hypothetical protein n=1 Tax=Dysgonomonas sp. 520 TaxID=2302931 RepID=UPI0013D1B183|nr:hypothetical protein [Dysgonomonas sp. 520]NDW09069.1 hypothetical protein [Dysgonomonas sp. 520]
MKDDTKKYLIIGGAAAALLLFSKKSKATNIVVETPTGVPRVVSITPSKSKRNNPLNIRYSAANDWLGKVSQVGDSFETFKTLEYGIRAGVKNLQTYYNKYGLTTISAIIGRWAPPTENLTGKYVEFVCGKMKLSPSMTVRYDADTFSKLVSAMSEMEQGQNGMVTVSEVKAVINKYSLF